MDGAPFKHGVTPAEIVYCQDIESWVFRHKDIRTSDTENGVSASLIVTSELSSQSHVGPVTLTVNSE